METISYRALVLKAWISVPVAVMFVAGWFFWRRMMFNFPTEQEQEKPNQEAVDVNQEEGKPAQETIDID